LSEAEFVTEELGGDGEVMALYCKCGGYKLHFIRLNNYGLDFLFFVFLSVS